MKFSTPVVCRILLFALLVGIAVGGYYTGAEPATSPGRCPLCGTPGVMVPDKDELEHCECESWWRDAVTRLVVADCSHRQCQEGSEQPRLLFTSLPLYRCPKDGLLFTEPTK